MIGLVGLPVTMGGVGGLVALSNWDVWFGGQSSNFVGPNQMNAMMGAVAVAGLGVFLTVLGIVRARSPSSRATEALAEAPALAAPPPVSTYVAPPPPRVVVPEPPVEEELYPAPEVTREVEPEVEEEPEEEEDEFVLPPAPAPAPAAYTPPPPAPVAPPAASAPPAAAERDELEDLFGELESEVAKAEEDEIHYECPNCHGIVREDDASCPHCHVTFEA